MSLDQLLSLGIAAPEQKPLLSLNEIANKLDERTSIDVGSDKVITFGFYDFRHAPGINNNPSYGEAAGYSPFTSEQRIAAESSIRMWDDLIAPSFVEKAPGPGASSWGRNDIDIWFANTSTGPSQAWSYYPEGAARDKRAGSDVWISDPQTNWTNEWLTNLGYGKTTLIHELGHSLGLSHPGEYDYQPGIALSYTNSAEYAQDSNQYTIMSYWGAAWTGANIINWLGQMMPGYAQTPLLHDVYVIQQKYGADTTTRSGETVYGFNSTAGREVYDFSKNPYPYLTIYDAGGQDTIDLSGFTASQFLDLHAGSFSSVGGGMPSAETANSYLQNLSDITGLDWGTLNSDYLSAQMAAAGKANAASIADDIAMTGHLPVNAICTSEYENVSIAYGVTIENGTGGSARDLLWGNEAANILKGMGGDDVLNGFQGADTLYGGAGNDTFMFGHVEKGDRVMDWNRGDKIDLREIDANSRTAGLQHFNFLGGQSFHNVAGELRYANGLLEGDVNGDGRADFTVLLIGSPSIGAMDLLL